MTVLPVVILFALICVAAFFAGWRLSRTAEPPADTTIEQARRFARLLMVASTTLLIFLLAVIIHGDLPLKAMRG
jgi:cytochrome bd-type quinol oxidase subunit 1